MKLIKSDINNLFRITRVLKSEKLFRYTFRLFETLPKLLVNNFYLSCFSGVDIFATRKYKFKFAI